MKFKQHEQAIPFHSATRLLVAPTLILILILLFVEPIISLLVEIPFIDSLGHVFDDTPSMSFATALAQILTVFASIFIILKVSEVKLPNIGLPFKRVFINILKGAFSGFLMLAIIGLIIQLLGGINITFNFKQEYTGSILLGLLFFSFQGTFEELLFRSYLLPHFSKKIGFVAATFVTSILFTLLHGLNPGMELLPIINLFLFSVIFSLIYYITGNLWLIGFIHALWNFSLGFIFGSMVSGLTVSNTILKSIPIKGEDLISGESFGFEGSIVTSIVAIIIIFTSIVIIRKKTI